MMRPETRHDYEFPRLRSISKRLKMGSEEIFHENLSAGLAWVAGVFCV